MYKLEFTLKQHTPLIHFQAQQAYAGLRATEVKPKLDNYLYQFEWDFQFDDFKKFLVGYTENREVQLFKSFDQYDACALDYRMKIHCSEPLTKDIKGFPCYFADVGSKDAQETKDKRLVYSENISIQIFSFHPELLNVIKKHFNRFLVAENFGNRQSKGFGGFYDLHSQQKDFDKDICETFTAVYKREIPKGDMPNDFFERSKAIFKKIDLEYKVLKAGDAGRKRESKLRQYFNGMRPVVEWEKPALLEKIGELGVNVTVRSVSSDRQYVRALLGLAQNFEYPHYRKGATTLKAVVKPQNPVIKRYRSPITVKVFDNTIYFCADTRADYPLPKENEPNMVNFEFNMDATGPPLSLKIPRNFDLDKFLAFAFKSEKGWTRLKG